MVSNASNAVILFIIHIIIIVSNEKLTEQILLYCSKQLIKILTSQNALPTFMILLAITLVLISDLSHQSIPHKPKGKEKRTRS